MADTDRSRISEYTTEMEIIPSMGGAIRKVFLVAPDGNRERWNEDRIVRELNYLHRNMTEALRLLQGTRDLFEAIKEQQVRPPNPDSVVMTVEDLAGGLATQLRAFLQRFPEGRA